MGRLYYSLWLEWRGHDQLYWTGCTCVGRFWLLPRRAGTVPGVGLVLVSDNYRLRDSATASWFLNLARFCLSSVLSSPIHRSNFASSSSVLGYPLLCSLVSVYLHHRFDVHLAVLGWLASLFWLAAHFMV